MFKRLVNLNTALEKKSHFLLGPRATGKTWLIRNHLKKAQTFDLLNLEIYDRLLKRPHSLAEEINSNLVVIDEIQKLPRLLDEVHRLIEEKGIRFLLTGSSARKLKRGGANLLAGRARSLLLYPLVTQEIDNFDLIKFCNIGGLPAIYSSEDPWLDLREYVHLYLKEEIMAEAIVRNIGHFAKFLDTIGSMSGQEVNYQSISSDSGVPVRTVANFIEILKDTLVAFELAPFTKSKNRKISTKNKIYLFDVGVANCLAGRKNLVPKSEEFGRAFEHFILQEIRSYLSYCKIDEPLTYWRPRGGDFEVDCIIGKLLAIEIKSTESFNEKMLKGLSALREEKQVKGHILVTQDKVERTSKGIRVMHYSRFLEELWDGKLLK